MPFFIELLIRGAVLSAVVLLLGSVPALRRLAAHGTMVTIALVWLVALPWLVARGPRVSLGLLPAAPWQEAPPRSPFKGVVDLAASQAPVAREELAPSLTSVDGQSVRASSHDARPDMTAAIYLIVTLALLVRRGAAAFRVHRVVRRTRFTTVPAIALRCARAAAARVGLRLTPRLCISSEVPLPFVFGLRRPVIVLSPESLTWSVARFEAVMLHEMAHVRRRDILTCGIADLACALNWFNPLVWIAAARLRSEAEVACDDAVVRSGVGAEAYARELVQLARKYRGAPFLSPAIGIVGESSLGHRVRTILTMGHDRGHVTALHVACGAFIACATALASAVITPVAVSAQSAQQVSAFNISNGGPEISSNGAGLQARWNDHGKHSAMFLSGDVDLREVASGQLRGSGRLLLIEEEGTGIKVFEWQSGQPEVLPTDVIRSLVTGAGQLERLTGGHRGFPGSSLSGLPAWSDDPSARVVQAGWLEGGERYGMALRGKWRASRDSLESQADEAWLVLFAFDPRRGTVRRLEIQRDKTRAFVSAYLVNGVPAPYDRRARDWSIAAFRLLQLMKPRDVDF